VWDKELIFDVVSFTGDTHFVRLQLLAVLVVATPGVVPGVAVSDGYSCKNCKYHNKPEQESRQYKSH